MSASQSWPADRTSAFVETSPRKIGPLAASESSDTASERATTLSWKPAFAVSTAAILASAASALARACLQADATADEDSVKSSQADGGEAHAAPDDARTIVRM